MNDTPLDSFQLDPEFAKLLLEALEREGLLAEVEGNAHDWLVQHGSALIEKYTLPATSWLARAMARPSEDENMNERTRMWIWVIANRLVLNAPKSMSQEQFQAWTFGLLSMGYMLKVDHESDKDESST